MTAVEIYSMKMGELLGDLSNQFTVNQTLKSHFLLVECLELEKQQIKDAYNQGYRDGALDGSSHTGKSDVENYSDADNYYNTLNQ